jgi:hypothetical protein
MPVITADNHPPFFSDGGPARSVPSRPGLFEKGARSSQGSHPAAALRRVAEAADAIGGERGSTEVHISVNRFRSPKII